MPHFLTLARIDWHYEQAPSALQRVLQGAHADLTGSHHTEDSFREALEGLAGEHHALVADALIQGTAGVFTLFHAARGEVRDVALEERPADAMQRKADLPHDGVASVSVIQGGAAIRALVAEQLDEDVDEDAADDDEIDLPLVYASEAALRAIADRVATVLAEDAEPFVAEAGNARFLVELSPRAARVRRLAFAGAGAAVAERLLRGALVEPPAPPRSGRDPSAKYELTLFWPEALLEEVQAAAVRTDRSLSSIIQLAWKTAAAAIAASEPAVITRVETTGRPRKQTVFMPGAMVDQLEAQAARLDMSQSRLVHHAFVLTRPAVAALPDG